MLQLSGVHAANARAHSNVLLIETLAVDYVRPASQDPEFPQHPGVTVARLIL